MDIKKDHNAKNMLQVPFNAFYVLLHTIYLSFLASDSSSKNTRVCLCVYLIGRHHLKCVTAERHLSTGAIARCKGDAPP